MRNGNLLLTVVLLLLLSSCSNEDNKDYRTSALSIRSVYSSASPETYSGSSDIEEIGSLWCHGNDIEWYNATTGELKFNNTPPAVRGFPPSYYEYLVVFLNDKELIRFETVMAISSNAIDRPCILDEGLSFSSNESRFYICKGYPRWDPRDRDERTAHWDWESIDEPREKNWKAIEPEWNIFIEQLKKEGRYRE